MFGLFSSVEKEMRGNASNWLELAEKIFHYRRDELSSSDLADLRHGMEVLRSQLKGRDDAGKLKLGIEALETTLRRVGGKFYPRSTLQEYVEFFVVAAIVVIGIQMYFFRPFKIPTNSMWPTYYGMTGEVFHTKAEEPGMAARAARFVLMGATRRAVDAPVDGEIWVPVGGGDKGVISSTIVNGRTWGIIPAKVRRVSVKVGTELVSLDVPLDFGFDRVIKDTFFPKERELADALRTHTAVRGDVPTGVNGATAPGIWIKTGKSVKQGERVLSFDILTGDQLFVDRISYHFVKPQVGSGFVFRTRGIPDIMNRYGDQYYIKRLVGTPGDKLEVRPPLLLRNDAPITGSTTFAKNFNLEGLYRGYAAIDLLAQGRTLTVSENNYFAMGDNSYESYDSRYWGEVPAKDVVGRPLFIYYPFTKRWGPAR